MKMEYKKQAEEWKVEYKREMEEFDMKKYAEDYRDNGFVYF